MEYTVRGRELIRDLRDTTRREVPVFNVSFYRPRRAILTLTDQLSYLYKKNTKDASLMNLETARALVPALKFGHVVMEWQIRFMLAYVYIRLAKLLRARWYYGATLPLGKDGLELTSTWRPLRTHMIQVYVLRDWEILTDDGDDIKLVSGSIQVLPSVHFEHLFNLGVIRIHKPNISRQFTRF